MAKSFSTPKCKLKEDIRLYTDEQMDTELLHISTQSIFDIAGTYDVHDSITREHVGSLKRQGLSSTFLRDRWQILNAEGNAIGTIEEDSALKAFLRRFVDAVAFFMPQAFHVQMDGRMVCKCQQNFNPFVKKLNVDFTPDEVVEFDRRLGLAAAILLMAIEGRQSS
ncbi:MAG: hypothetical protein WD009_09270 [Phycisphaeraceae bacterium]